MVVGTTLTLVPWLALAIGSQVTSGARSQAPTHIPSTAADALGGITLFVFSAVIEAVFLLAPLYFALTLPGDSSDDTQANGARANKAHAKRAKHAELALHIDTSWPMRWRRAALALGFSKTITVTANGNSASRRQVVWLTAWVSALALGASALYSIALSAIHAPLQTNADALAQQAHTAPLTTLGALLAAVLVAPWCEEIFFRGFVFPGLLRRLPVWPAATISALLFALAHADLGSFLPLALIGLALAYLRWRTRSLWPCVALHTLNNLVAAVLLAPAFFSLLR